MYPHERSLVKEYDGRPFVIIGVNSDEDREALRETLAAESITWRSFWNGPDGTAGPISTKWNVTGWPTTYVIDHQGTIRFKDVRGEQLDAAVKQLVLEAEADAAR